MKEKKIYYQCSKCGKTYQYIIYNCPECGGIIVLKKEKQNNLKGFFYKKGG